MIKRKLTLSKQTLYNLQSTDLQKAAAGETILSWNSQCTPTCGPNSCLGACSFNCSFLLCADQDA